MPLLFHLLLVAVSLAPCAGEPTADGTYDASVCPTSLSCGDGVDIHYPFYLSNESEVMDRIADSYCGYPGMAIACVRGHPVLHLNNDSYTVLDIDYGNNTFSLADTDALDGGLCPRVRHNVTIPPLLGPLMKFPSAATDYLSFFFNCATPAIPHLSDVEPINCIGFDGGTGLSYVFAQPDVPAGGWLRACKEAYVVPVLRDSLRSVQNNSLLREGMYGVVLKQGFQLTWDPSAGPCIECERSKGQCSYNHSGGFLGCLCSDGSVRNLPDCGYRLFCTNGTLVIYMNSASFQVTNADHDNHLLTVIDQILAQETCLQSYRNTTINDAMFMYTDHDQFLNVYVNCSAKS